MFIKNISQHKVSLFGGQLLVTQGAVETLTKIEAESKEVNDALRRGWLKEVASLNEAEAAIAPELVIETPPTEKSLSVEEVKAASQKARRAKPDASVKDATEVKAE